MKEAKHKITLKIKFLYNFFKSLLFDWLMKAKFNKVQTFVMFIGYPRSGHSLIGALLDAHPHIVMGMEWNVFYHIKMGFNQNMIFYSILHNSKIFNKRLENVWGDYSYKVNNKWQGDCDELHVIGDKLGGRTSMMIYENPDLLDLIKERIHLPLKYIHVIRNPFDIITTMTKRSFEISRRKGNPENLDLLPIIKNFLNRVDTVNRLKTNGELQIYDLYHEDFINNPEEGLKSLLKFLGVNGSLKYIEDCVKIVYNEPHKSRFDIEWQKDLIHYVEQQINKYSFLKRYSWSH